MCDFKDDWHCLFGNLTILDSFLEVVHLLELVLFNSADCSDALVSIHNFGSFTIILCLNSLCHLDHPV
jgi:hypothetical protein